MNEGEILRDTLFARCKSALKWAYILKAGVFVAGVAVVVFALSWTLAPFLVAVLAGAAELVMWRSDYLKGEAESIHRKLDFEDSFGWPVSEHELRDLWARLKDGRALPREGNYFASKSDPGTERALQNLRESCWWSKHLSRSMAWMTLMGILLLILGCFIILLVAVASVPDLKTAADIVRIVTSSLMLLFSFGLLRLWFGYYNFGSKAERIEGLAISLQKADKAPDQHEVVKLWNDYHLSRASAPVLPTWLWNNQQVRLNALWKRQFGKTASSPS